MTSGLLVISLIIHLSFSFVTCHWVPSWRGEGRGGEGKGGKYYPQSLAASFSHLKQQKDECASRAHILKNGLNDTAKGGGGCTHTTTFVMKWQSTLYKTVVVNIVCLLLCYVMS